MQVKSKVKISQNYVAFSDYMNFNISSHTQPDDNTLQQITLASAILPSMQKKRKKGGGRKNRSGRLRPIVKPELAAFYYHFCVGAFPFPYYDPA